MKGILNHTIILNIYQFEIMIRNLTSIYSIQRDPKNYSIQIDTFEQLTFQYRLS